MTLNIYAFTKKWNISGKYDELWNKFSSTIKNRFDCPVDNEKYLRTKMREKSYKGKISTNLHKDKIPKNFLSVFTSW